MVTKRKRSLPSVFFRLCWKNGQNNSKICWKNGQKVVILHWKNGQIMLKRKIDSCLDDFFKNNNKALLVTGARQTGKSFSISHFGATHFESFIEINFIEMPDAVDVISQAKDRDDMLLRLSALADRPLILSGSLLGLELNDLRSEPVGYMDVVEMFPLDLEEFFMALGVNDDVMQAVKDAWESKKPVPDFIHTKLMELFRLYLIVGGMPAVVQKYLDTNNLQDVLAEQQAIIRLYKRDIAKYDRNHKLYIEEIFDMIPSELNAKNKRFILKNLNENMKFSRYENSFIWLKDAGVALPVYNVEEPTMPLKLSRSRNLFKLFQNDVGLLTCQFAEGIQLRILKDDKGINFGSVYENVVAQELHAHGFELYYFNSKKQGELDCVIERDGKAVPIEVKSGKEYQRHNALTNVLANPDYQIKEAIVFSNNNLSRINKTIYLPIYMAAFIKKATLPPITYTVDLSGLR